MSFHPPNLPIRPDRKMNSVAGPGLRAFLLVLLVLLGPFHAKAAQSSQPARTEQKTPAAPLPAEEQPASGVPAEKTELVLLGKSAVLIEKNAPPQIRQFQETWSALLDRHNPDLVFATNNSPLPPPVLAQWKTITAKIPSMAPDEKLRIINGFFNNWSSIADDKNYGQEEYWASPAEFLHNGGGDCEDYAIIKYLALRHFSWPKEDLWIVFVDDLINKGKHAVLAARIHKRIFILDNLSRPAYLLIPEKQYEKQVAPLFALNEQGVWVFAGKTGEPKPEGKKSEARRQP